MERSALGIIWLIPDISSVAFHDALACRQAKAMIALSTDRSPRGRQVVPFGRNDTVYAVNDSNSCESAYGLQSKQPHG